VAEWVLVGTLSGVLETDWRWLAAIDSLAAVPIPFCGTNERRQHERPLTDGGAEHSQPTQRTTQPSNKQTNKQTNQPTKLQR
jgi:hypothetical protein